jgi:hypothetical protein
MLKARAQTVAADYDVMTSFTLIPGAAPLVIATGASMSARGSLAIAAISGMPLVPVSPCRWSRRCASHRAAFYDVIGQNEAIPEASPDA